MAVLRRVVSGFLPSTAGFQFPNLFPHIRVTEISVGAVKVPIGNAHNGLCGGMVYAVRDYFEVGSAPPQIIEPPTSGPLYDYIVRRLFISFELPGGPYTT
jgi:hypothetical protein